jgi:hypothetical protein
VEIDKEAIKKRTLALVTAKPEYVQDLKVLLELDTENKVGPTIFASDSPTGRGFFSEDLHDINWGRLGHLISLGILVKFWESNSSSVYCLADPDSVRAAIELHETAVEQLKETEYKPGDVLAIPDDLFDCVIGYDDIKEILKAALTSPKPVSFLFVGPPSSAKTVILRECERIHGSRLIVAGTSTRVGIRDVLFEEAPAVLLIDELDKVSNGRELSALLTWIQDQRVIVTKHGEKAERCGRGQVIAACNDDSGVPDELQSRFMSFYFKSYTDEEFRNVSMTLLTKREGVDEEVAKHITESVLAFSRDVRMSINIARLCTTKEAVDRMLKTMRRHSRWDCLTDASENQE